jgi:hypothetical protein
VVINEAMRAVGVHGVGMDALAARTVGMIAA